VSEHHERLIIAGLKTLVAGQNTQNKLLEILIQRMPSQQDQLQQWKQANPRLSQDCQRAAEALGKMQQDFVQELTDEVLREGVPSDEWACREFIDKYGQRLMQLNGMVAYLTQLGT